MGEEMAHDDLMSTFLARCFIIPAQGAYLRKESLQIGFHAFSAGTIVADVGTLTVGASPGHFPPVPAMVAGQRRFRPGLLNLGQISNSRGRGEIGRRASWVVIGQGIIAAWAKQTATTITAEYVSRRAPPVQKEDRLLVPRQNLLERFAQGTAEYRAVATFQLLPHINHMHRRQIDRLRLVLQGLILGGIRG